MRAVSQGRGGRAAGYANPSAVRTSAAQHCLRSSACSKPLGHAGFCDNGKSAAALRHDPLAGLAALAQQASYGSAGTPQLSLIHACTDLVFAHLPAERSRLFKFVHSVHVLGSRACQGKVLHRKMVTRLASHGWHSICRSERLSKSMQSVHVLCLFACISMKVVSMCTARWSQDLLLKSGIVCVALQYSAS